MKAILLLLLSLLITILIIVLNYEPPEISQAKMGDIVWNYANASQQTYYDLPTSRLDDAGIGRPGDAAPVVLQEPCNSWHNLTWIWRARLTNDISPYGKNPCAWCHCNTDMHSYYWDIMQISYPSLPDDVCVPNDGTCNVKYIGLPCLDYRWQWLTRPNQIVIRWRR